jgi:epoxyqueuosine reductase
VRILLHICCGPCSTEVFERLKEHDVTGYFYNPNIEPKKEYENRLEAAKLLCTILGTNLVEGPYENDAWREKVRGHEADAEGGERCSICYRMRMEQAALYAKERGFNMFATTLTMSPHKSANVINAIGREIGSSTGIKFLEADWKKQAGFQKSLEHSRRHNLYRQNYCGCSYSTRALS